MREIKFRAKKDSSWVYGSLVLRNGQSWVYFNNVHPEGLEAVMVEPETVGQYVVKIELANESGDVVRELDVYEGDLFLHENCVYQIFYENGCFHAGNPEDLNESYDFYYWYFNYTDGDYVKYIGNIHDNPELLEVEA